MHRILIVEDDTLMARVYVDKFRSVGFDVDLAMDGATAIQRLEAAAPDIVLLDLMLGEVNGVEVLKFARANETTRTVPILVLSNAFMGDLVQAAWKAGANKCLAKSSCSPNKLVDEARSLLAPLAAEGARASAAAPAAPAAPALPPPTGDERVQESLRRELVESIRIRLGEARQALHDWVKSNEGPGSPHLQKLYTASHSLANAGLAGFSRLAHLAAALEALLKDLLANPKKFNASAIRTITQAVELTPALFRNSEAPQQEVFATPMIMLVDDDAISRETISSALDRAHLRALRLDDPSVALRLVDENRFDLIFLDIDMPGISGFTLCEKIHATDTNLTTPVVFVTGLSDFETRSHSTESGAVDFIAKPVWLNELALKSIFHLLRGRILAAI